MLPNLATGRVRAAVRVISADELIENGGSFRLQGRVAYRVNNLTGQTNLPASHQAMAVYPITQADIDSGRFVLAGGGPAVRVVDIDSEGISRPVMGGGAVPVYVVEGEALGVTPVVLPDAPSGLLAVQNGSGQIDLTWDAATSADGYYVERSDGNNTSFVQVDDVATNSASDTGLASALYYYRVRAYNGQGESGYSNEASVVVALFRDSFSVNQAAPITSPRTPDVGANATVLDTGSYMPVSGGKLHILGVQTAFANPMYTSGAITNQTGACHIAQGISLASSASANSNANVACGARLAFSENAPGTLGFLSAGAGPSNLSVSSIQNSTVFFVRSYGNLTLPIHYDGSQAKVLFVPYSTHATTMQFFPGNTIGGVGGDISLSEIRSVYLPAPYSTEYGLATNRIATTSNGSTSSSEANAIIEHTIVAVTGVTQELMVRRIDDDNCIIIRMDQAGSTIKVIKKETTAETELASFAQTWTNGSSYRIAVILDGSSIKTYVAAPTNFGNRNNATSTYNQTETGIKVSHAGTNLVALPLYLSGAALGILDF